MRIRNIKTGEIKTIVVPEGVENLFSDWEDASNSIYYYITEYGKVEYEYRYPESPKDKKRKEFGNYFDDVESAVYVIEQIKKIML